MQQKLLEQQKLFEAERSQFYQVSQQVLNSITQVNVKQHAPNSGPTVPKALSTMSKSLSDVSMVGSPIDCSKSNPPTPMSVHTPHSHGVYPKPTTPHYQSGPPTSLTAYSPYSPAGSSVYSTNPSPMPLTTQHHAPTTPHQIPTSLDSQLNMMYSQPAQQFPPYLQQNPYVSSSALTAPQSYNQEPTSLSMHNDLVCDSLGLSNGLPIGQTCQSVTCPAISHIQTLSDMFGGH